MVTIFHTEKNILKEDGNYILTELRGLSTDSKPTQIDENIIENGSIFIEIDTQDVYIYDGVSKECINPDVTSQSEEQSEDQGD